MKSNLTGSGSKRQLLRVYEFLQKNKKYNTSLHLAHYKAVLAPYSHANKRAYALLFDILNTQSQLKLDKAHEFFSDLLARKGHLNSFTGFIRFLNGGVKETISFKKLYELLRESPGWGDKTSALFVKAVYNIHCSFAKKYAIWNDVPDCLVTVKDFYLPVDEVIKYIFKYLEVPCSYNFKGINNFLAANFSDCNPIIWDELWFWGYITQESRFVDGKPQRVPTELTKQNIGICFIQINDERVF